MRGETHECRKDQTEVLSRVRTPSQRVKFVHTLGRAYLGSLSSQTLRWKAEIPLGHFKGMYRLHPFVSREMQISQVDTANEAGI